MDIIPLTLDRYEDWDAFSLSCDDAWFWHTTAWLDYTLAYRPDLTPTSKSFMVIDGGRVQAICPLIVEERLAGEAGKTVREFSFGGGFGPPPVFSTQTREGHGAELQGYGIMKPFSDLCRHGVPCLTADLTATRLRR